MGKGRLTGQMRGNGRFHRSLIGEKQVEEVEQLDLMIFLCQLAVGFGVEHIL
jgi:hypothetical protein